MNVLVIMHADAEGPGTLGEFLAAHEASLRTVKLHRGGALPQDPGHFDAIVLMGGPMSVLDEKRHPWLCAENIFLHQAIQADVPVLGFCLGAQLIAKACGARIRKAPMAELGWKEVFLTGMGEGDRLFYGLPKTFTVLQWHEDTFDLPTGGVLLAEAIECPHQAFRVRNAYGLQFHVEVTHAMLAAWCEPVEQGRDILYKYDFHKGVFDRHAGIFYSNFLRLITNTHQQ